MLRHFAGVVRSNAWLDVSVRLLSPSLSVDAEDEKPKQKRQFSDSTKSRRVTGQMASPREREKYRNIVHCVCDPGDDH